MAIGRLQMAFIGARVKELPKDNATAVQRQLSEVRTVVKFGASASADSEKSRALFWAPEELGPMLAYVLEDPEW